MLSIYSSSAGDLEWLFLHSINYFVAETIHCSARRRIRGNVCLSAAGDNSVTQIDTNIDSTDNDKWIKQNTRN